MTRVWGHNMGMATAKRLEEILVEIPEIRGEVEDFANYLWEKNHSVERKPPRFTGWAGVLKGQEESMSSVDWQHTASKWRSEEK